MAIGTEPVETAVFAALIAGSGRLTAASKVVSFEFTQEVSNGGSRVVQQRRDGGVRRQRQAGKERNRDKPDERSRMIRGTVQRLFSFPTFIAENRRERNFRNNICKFYRNAGYVWSRSGKEREIGVTPKVTWDVLRTGAVCENYLGHRVTI